VDEKHTAKELYARDKHERNRHIAKRLQALVLLRRGTPTRQVARIVGVSRMSIHKWRTGSRTGGLNKITRRTRGGNRIPVRPRLTPDQQAQRIPHAATQGFRTLREAAAWCREALGAELSERPMQRLFHRLGVRAQTTASDGGACGRGAAGAVEKRGFRAALTAQGVRVGQRVVFVDALRVGLIGQVRRRWTVRGVKLCPRVERSSKWRDLQVAVDPLSGEVWQRWSARLGKEAAVAALSEWRALGVEVVVWENAGSHRARAVREVGVALVYLPAYSPELNPVARVLCAVRRCVEGVVYGSLEAKLAAVAGALGGLRDGMVRLVGWDWIREALAGLPCDS
jgi:transposase